MVRSKNTTSVIYLLGMPGCGKSTLGRKLAQQLNKRFVDLDEYIESEAGLSIPEIFEQSGEGSFRELERQAVQATTEWENTVIACGGGAPCYFDNMDIMNLSGKTIYIHVSPEEIFNRISNKGQDERPLLAGKDSEHLIKELRKKKHTRDIYYKKAQIIFLNDNLKVNDLTLCLH